MAFETPGPSDRTTVMGMTGSGKTQGATYLLARQDFESMPWIILNFKRESMFYEFNPFQLNDKWDVPQSPGIYMADIDWDLVSPDEVNELLRRVKSRGSCGLFIDEGTELGYSSAFKSCLTQGRSLQIPMIICTQRPTDITVYAFTEANYYMIFDLNRPEDKKKVAGYCGRKEDLPELPRYHFWWYDRIPKVLKPMRPVPDRAVIVANIAARQKALAETGRARVYI